MPPTPPAGARSGAPAPDPREPAPPGPARAADGLRAAFRRAASSVWVVTAASAGAPAGFTATSVASVSVDPPLLSFNVGRTSSSLATLQSGGACAVHLLAAGSEALARTFAGPAAARFADPAAWRWGEDGLPELAGVAARLSGPVTALVPAGDSVIVVVEVQRTAVHERPSLVHHDRAYTALPAPPPAGPQRTAGASLRACS
ncbi:flavin reductase (DIM6/NTAB) family NADH-FMN oxidoreductase RutF [Kineococcus xinjiangensis]|uniref:Flavin reductase (DIM6/NTAB) family NADH-FMN oxidoreductase RutF n=1 Tax=Kineococcus xinjiangensis TaxID=512762 RepID=A0A2S6IUA4_9ACTN|nr:flavin reductase family protein [Kineococcus xinjiangensis]PPK97636.1 flavin reductase (DIM6/NTAB) family NADH-FMN oxidoreductase RutF [Kineococcus xinjiangensis]